MSSTRPTTIGGSITVSDSQSLANLSIAGLPPGTTVWNEDVGAFFKLTTCARRDIVLDPTDFYDTGVFTFAAGDFTAADEGQTLVVRFDYPNAGYNNNYLIDSVDSATEITVLPAPADASVEPFTGAVTVVETGPSEVDVVVSVQAGAVFGVVWRIVIAEEAENAVTADGPTNAVTFMNTLQAANDVIVTQAIASVNLDITGLDGETDGDYEMMGVLLLTGNGATNSVDLQPENLGTNQAGAVFYGQAAAAAHDAALTTLNVGFTTNTADSTMVFKAYLSSKSGRVRVFKSSSYCPATTTYVLTEFVGSWSGTATPITKLRFVSSQLLRVGSFVRLRKLRNQT